MYTQSTKGGGSKATAGSGGGAAATESDEPDWVLEHAAKCSDAKKTRETEKHQERELKFKRMRNDLSERRAKVAARVRVNLNESHLLFFLPLPPPLSLPQ